MPKTQNRRHSQPWFFTYKNIECHKTTTHVVRVFESHVVRLKEQRAIKKEQDSLVMKEGVRTYTFLIFRITKNAKQERRPARKSGDKNRANQESQKRSSGILMSKRSGKKRVGRREESEAILTIPNPDTKPKPSPNEPGQDVRREA